MTKSLATEDSVFGGIAMWRRIADAIRLDIVGGKLARGDRLPGEIALAERFQVNRHTVRRALANLAEEGVVRAEQGRGTFVDQARRLSYRIGKRTRWSEGLAGQARNLERRILSSRIDNAGVNVATALKLKPGAKTLRLEQLALADGRPLSRATSWFDYRRFPDFAERFEASHSVTTALRTYGINDYSRATTHISARHADAEETRLLRLAPGAILLVSEAIDADAEGRPIQYGLSRFPADRMELIV
jgi:GntR family transcriptional regulator, phosphonate transport system regulatory protein